MGWKGRIAQDGFQPVLKAGLTGGIATGKSYVLSRLRDHGIPCLDADVLAHGSQAAPAPRRPRRLPGVSARTFWMPHCAVDAAGSSARSMIHRRGGAPRSRGDRASGGLSRDRRRAARRSNCSRARRSPSSTFPLLKRATKAASTARRRDRLRSRDPAGQAERAGIERRRGAAAAGCADAGGRKASRAGTVIQTGGTFGTTRIDRLTRSFRVLNARA